MQRMAEETINRTYTSLPSRRVGKRVWQPMDHMEMSQPSVHRVYLQQSTKEKADVLNRRHHMCLWKSRKSSQLAHPCSLDDLIMFNDVGKQCTELWKRWFDDTTMLMSQSRSIKLILICFLL